MKNRPVYVPAALLLGTAAILTPAILPAQDTDLPAQAAENPDVVVYGTPPADLTGLTEGPEVEGMISARKDDKMQITTADGTNTVVFLSEATKIKSSKGLFGLDRSKLAADQLLNGLPVKIKTVQWSDNLVASKIDLRDKDLKTASMIRTGTAQGFAEQTAATEALRGRVADIDQYNLKGTTNVYFDTGKWRLTPQAEAELCGAANQAGAMDNALLLVVGYTDSVGDYDYNQTLSERRASRVVNHLQQACGWKPYRMLTPTGMAEADPVADNGTTEGKAQNRRVSVNILVSKSVDGL
ncbi:MAG: OmpA family protein [Sphingomonadales bacterium]|nr:OmpA family protein [Sphingomonadales bacterium]